MENVYYGKSFFRKLESAFAKKSEQDKSNVIIHMTSPYRSFAIFDTHRAFRSWYLSIARSERYFDEVILEGWQKFRVDIDVDSRLNLQKYMWDKIVEEYAHQTRFMLTSLNISQEILIYDSSNSAENKYSCHLVANGCSFSSSRECLYLCNLLSENIQEPMRIFLDGGVYKSTQCFRLEGSKKPGTERYKYLCGHDRISPFFLAGMITNVSDTQKMSLQIEEDFLSSDDIKNISESL